MQLWTQHWSFQTNVWSEKDSVQVAPCAMKDFTSNTFSVRIYKALSKFLLVEPSFLSNVHLQYFIHPTLHNSVDFSKGTHRHWAQHHAAVYASQNTQRNTALSINAWLPNIYQKDTWKKKDLSKTSAHRVCWKSKGLLTTAFKKKNFQFKGKEEQKEEY